MERETYIIKSLYFKNVDKESGREVLVDLEDKYGCINTVHICGLCGGYEIYNAVHDEMWAVQDIAESMSEWLNGGELFGDSH